MDEVAKLLNDMVQAGVIVNTDIRALLEKQAMWQRTRAVKPWADKLRLSVSMRAAVRSMRKSPASTEKAVKPRIPGS